MTLAKMKCKIRCILIILITILYIPIVSANGSFLIDNEIELPGDLHFSEHDHCSNHACFMQAAADVSGSFAVYSLHVNPEDYADVNFKKVYVDIYNADGKFLKELSFETSQEVVLDIEQGQINVYSRTAVLSYNLDTGELKHYKLEENSHIFEEKKSFYSKAFTVGSWEYRYEDSFLGHSKLIRSNGTTVQMLVEMNGMDTYTQSYILPGCIIGVVGFVLCCLFFKRKHRGKKDESATS